jgi:DNA-binding response OmpR family regulator
MSFKVIVVEDEESINDILTISLQDEGYEVYSAFSCKEAKDFVNNSHVDLALLDLNLPDGNGFELCKYITEKYKIPIIMLTARNDIIDKVLGLELGADDYITKPFHIKEVITRVKVALRRMEMYSHGHKNEIVLRLNDNIMINVESRQVRRDNQEIKLKPREYDLLLFLIKHKNKVFSRDELLDKVWGFEYDGDSRTVDIHVRRLRAKLGMESGQSSIETIFGVGYIMR